MAAFDTSRTSPRWVAKSTDSLRGSRGPEAPTSSIPCPSPTSFGPGNGTEKWESLPYQYLRFDPQIAWTPDRSDGSTMIDLTSEGVHYRKDTTEG
jgi:hypothetical protein